MVMKKQFKLAACFFLLTVLLRGVSVADACKNEHEDCSTEACCEGLECVEVTPGVFECEPEGCESHEGHSCEPGVRECCDHLKCVEVSPGDYKCEHPDCEDHVGHSCDTERVCCEPLECSTECDTCFNPNCTLELGETCDPTSSVCCKHRAVCSTSTKKCECADVCTDEDDCCEGYFCSSTDKCECKKKEGDPCNPDACVDECCDLDCVAVAPNTYECHSA